MATITVKNAAGVDTAVELPDAAATRAAQFGSITETAPASDTASSGLNGRLQRVSQRLTSLIAMFGSGVTIGNVGLLAGTALIGNVAQVLRATTNGLTSSRVVSAATTNATSIKGSAGTIARISVFNAAASMRHLKLYNKATAPTVGTDTPIWTIPLPAGGGFTDSFPFGIFCSVGIAYAITAGQADSDTAAVVAGDITGQIDWV